MPEFFGLDLGSHTLKAVELAKHGDSFHLQTFGSTPTPAGSILSESELDQKELVKAVNNLVKETGINSRNVTTAFAESQIFTRVIEIPEMSEKELASAIRWEAEQYIPMPLSDVKISWMVLGREKGKEKRPARHSLREGEAGGEKSEGIKMKVFLVAAPLTLIEKYMKVVRRAGLTPVVFETEIVAIARAFSPKKDHLPSTMIVSIGASTTDLCIVDGGVIQFTRSIGTGGAALARAVAQELGFEMGQAEEYKKSYGLLEDQLEGKIMNSIKPVFDVIVNEIDRARLYYQTHQSTSVVKRIVLTGGSAQLPGIVVYLAENLGVEVQIGNPWENVLVPDKLKEKVDQLENQVNYAVAVGLAMKEI
ncbi:MAG: pilus assembly protein PilM [Candidatus Cloacimonetes bacterium]|nr:pilus assembly protein PilM [Candidatus Cloacimonadota bacterium]